jgi:hypothetical protein
MLALSYLPLVLQALLLGVLLRRKAFKSFPWFLAYTAFSVLATSARFLSRNSHAAYYWIYWTTDSLYLVLGVAVLYEVFYHVFHKIARSRWSHVVFFTFVTLTILLTLTRIRHPSMDPDRFVHAVLAAEMGVRFLQVLMFLLLLVLAALYALRWRQPAFGICAGYGIYASVNLLTTTKYYEFGTKFTYLWGWVSVITYTIAVLIWLLYFAAPIEEETLRGERPPLSPQELERYKEIVRRVQRP